MRPTVGHPVVAPWPLLLQLRARCLSVTLAAGEAGRLHPGAGLCRTSSSWSGRSGRGSVLAAQWGSGLVLFAAIRRAPSGRENRLVRTRPLVSGSHCRWNFLVNGWRWALARSLLEAGLLGASSVSRMRWHRSPSGNLNRGLRGRLSLRVPLC